VVCRTIVKRSVGGKVVEVCIKFRNERLDLRFPPPPPPTKRIGSRCNQLVNRKSCFYIFITLTHRINQVPQILPHIMTYWSNRTIQPPSEWRGIVDMMKDHERNDILCKDVVLTIVSQLEIAECEVTS
jgi:hypothetical protein